MVLVTSSLCKFSSTVANHRPLAAARQNSPVELATLSSPPHTGRTPLLCSTSKSADQAPINLQPVLTLNTWRAGSLQSQACGLGSSWIPSDCLGARVRSSSFVSSRGCTHGSLPCPRASSWWIHSRQVPPLRLHTIMSPVCTQRLHTPRG
jgi:hypothetical protein